MAQFLIYLLKVSLWLLPLYGLYLFLYKRFTFFSWNRYYLLSIVLLSFILPFVHLNLVETNIIWTSISNQNSTPTQFVEQNYSGWNDLVAQKVANIDFEFSWIMLFFIGYCFGVILALIKLLNSLASIQHLISKSKRLWTNNLALVHTTDKVPHSSFFHYIFLNKKVNNTHDVEKIIYHEMQHNEKMHTWDVLFCELLKVVLWFNPIVYYFKKSLQEVHEFEVDSEMTKLYNEVTYAELLVKVATGQPHSLSSAFSTKPLKTRLKMIFNHKTYPMKKLSFLLVVPIIAFLLVAFGNIHTKSITIIKSKQEKPVLVIDAGHGGKDAGALYGTVSEKEINLNIAQILMAKADERGYKVIMTRDKDTFIELKQRAELTKNANLFISLHCNKKTDKSPLGIQCYISQNNVNGQVEQSKLMAQSVLNQTKTLEGIHSDDRYFTRHESIWVLKHSYCPSVLLEMGNLENKNDFDFITNYSKQHLLADKIIDGITSFIEKK